jgi:hypothetical protein
MTLSTPQSKLKKASHVAVLLVFIFGQTASAQNLTANITTTAPASTEASAIDSAVACIIARELFEASLFIGSHFGSILKNQNLPWEQKSYYLKRMVPATAGGMVLGAAISLGVGYGIKSAVDSLDTVSNGVELGEGLSKAIGFWFVTKMALKLPSQFGIRKIRGAALDPAQELALESALSLSASLFGNTLREFAEGGILTALTVILSEQSMARLGPSVGVGVGAAVVLGGGFMAGARYISPKLFGVVATVISATLAVGLGTGAIRSFESYYASQHNETKTPVIYDEGGTSTGNILTSFEAFGISDNLTALTLTAFVVLATSLVFLEVWYNVLGYPLVHPAVQNKYHAFKHVLKAPFVACWRRIAGPQLAPGEIVL